MNFNWINQNEIFLLNKIKQTKDLLLLLNDDSHSINGNIYEKIWDLIIKLGYSKFNNSAYDHYDGNMNNDNLNKIQNLEICFKKTKLLSKNEGGASDITLRHTNGTWIFISSKYRDDDSKSSIKDYDIQDIISVINKHKHKYIKWEIWLIVNDKSKVQKIIDNSQKTNDHISENIKGILDINDLSKHYNEIHCDLVNINLDKKGEINDRFNNSLDIFKLRFHQDLITTQSIDRISQGEKTLLWGWKCRAGKTFGVGGILLKYYNKFNKCNSLIITPAPTETITQFVDDMFNKYRDFNKFNIIEIKNGNELRNYNFSGDNNIIILSKQLLDDYTDNDTKIENIIKLNLDMIIFDENHFGGCSQLSKNIISTYSSVNTIKLLLTATYQKPISEWNIPSHCQFYWNIDDEQICKQRNIDKLLDRHGEEVSNFLNVDNKEEKLKVYDNMPNLELITTIMDSHRYDIIREQIKDTKFGFSMEVLFSLNKNNKFNYPKEVEDVLSYMSGSSTDCIRDTMSIFERIKKISKNKNSRTNLCNEDFTTQLWFLPFGQGMKIKHVSECLEKKIQNDNILKKYETMIINSDKEYKLKDLKGDISRRELKAKSEGKLGLILLAGNQCSLGITLPFCDIVVLLNNTLSFDKILQMMYRCMSESSDGSKKCGFVVDLNISRVMNTLIEYNIHEKNNNIQQKIEYLIENNLINIDSDLFNGCEKENQYGVKLVTKLLDLWKSDPINHHKRLLKRIENSVLELESEDQNMVNKYFTSSEKINHSVEIKMDENNEQDLPNGKDKTKVNLEGGDDTENKNEDEENKEKDKIIKISLTKDILPFVVPLSCILTMDDEHMDFVQMLENIKNNKSLLQVFNDQSTIWWNHRDIINLITDIVKKYVKKNSETYNIAIQFKMSLQSLIDRPKELLELIDSCLKPKELEKKKHGEVFTPMSIVEEMLDKLEEQYVKENGKSIFTEKHLKWLDPANGMGNYPIAVYLQLMKGLVKEIPDKKLRKKHILEQMLYMAEFNKKNVFVTRQIFDIKNEYDLNIIHGDSLDNEILDVKKFLNVDSYENIVCIGNPPYQKNLESKKGSAPALYNKFIDEFIDKCKYQSFIIPSRWFAGGKGLDKFRENMLKRKDIVYIRHFDDASKVFGNNISIEGGVNYYLKSNNYNDLCCYNNKLINLGKYDILINDKYYSIIDKLDMVHNISHIYIGQGYAGITSNDKRLKHNSINDDYVKCYVSKVQGFVKYIDINNLKERNYDKWKVITTEANGGNKCFGRMFIGKPMEICNQSFILFEVDSEEEAKSLLSYLKCKLPNLLLGLRKISQHINKGVCKWIPLPPLDQIWSNEEIYKHFKLSEEDIKLVTDTKIGGYKETYDNSEQKNDKKFNSLEEEIEIINKCTSDDNSIQDLKQFAQILATDIYQLISKKVKNPVNSLKTKFKKIYEEYGGYETDILDKKSKLYKLNKIDNIYFKVSKRGSKTWIYKYSNTKDNKHNKINEDKIPINDNTSTSSDSGDSDSEKYEKNHIIIIRDENILKKMTVKKLKSYIKDNKLLIKYSKLRKNELIEAIINFKDYIIR